MKSNMKDGRGYYENSKGKEKDYLISVCVFQGVICFLLVGMIFLCCFLSSNLKETFTDGLKYFQNFTLTKEDAENAVSAIRNYIGI